MQQSALTTAADLVRTGNVIVFPTDTVYGIGCDPWSAAAIEKLYAAKRRPEEKGLPILISDEAQLERLIVGTVDERVKRLIGRFWPGALTLIFKRNPALPNNIAPGDTIAVRLPNLALTRDLIQLAGGAVATSSANISGEAAAVSVENARAMLGNSVAAIIDGGVSSGGVPSTIVDCTTQKLTIIREGAISKDVIRDA